MKKVCKCCGRNRKIGKFGQLTRSPDGKNPYCRDCMRAFHKKYRTGKGRLKHKKTVEKWKSENKDKISDYNKEYYIRKKDRIIFNKKVRESRECVLITEIPEKPNKRKINKSTEVCIVINPQRKKNG